jgi:hypothetical protein
MGGSRTSSSVSILAARTADARSAITPAVAAAALLLALLLLLRWPAAPIQLKAVPAYCLQ